MAVLVVPPAPVLAAPAEWVPSGGEISTVTLITGDLVTVRGDRAVSVSMHDSRKAIRFWQQTRNGHDYVIPMDAAKALAEDRLDERLFDVTELVRQGYDDKNTREIPVIVSAPQGARAAAIPSVAKVTREMGRAGMLSAAVPKDRAADFFATAPGTKIWLDGKVQATLDQSVPQTGAPQAWQAGYRADGVKVAVLDTGADATHADLAGRIDASANFTTDPDAKDGYGHGTHVASTIAGSGSASGGRYQGMAPGARLLVGKVLDNRGSGSESGIIAGMQWAAEQGARVVNMSLGAQYASTGNDPMSLALNEISVSTGALFVVSAGNLGQDVSVTAPGAADKALTVASVTKSGRLSVFSSRGPRRGDNGMKPEIAAPGSDIVAARATGTLTEQSVNTSYAKLSGTSMASPHVAGAAAIVAGQHPDWRADQIKAALVGSAKTIPETNPFGQGSGVVDVARATRQQTRVEPAAISLSGGQSEAGLLYFNDSDRPVELTVSVDMRYRNGTAAPAGLFSVSADKVVVPAKNKGKLTLRAMPTSGQNGQFVGTITATDGQAKLTTPVAVTLAGERHTLTVRATDRQGYPGASNIVVQNETTGEQYGDIVQDGVYSVEVPAGRYRVIGQVLESGWNVSGVTTFAVPGTDITKDTEIPVSASDAKPVTVSVDDPTARADRFAGGTGVVSTVNGQNGAGGAGVLFGGGPTLPLYAKGSPEIPGVEFAHVSQWQVPWTAVTVLGPKGYELVDVADQSREGWRGSVTGKLVDVGDAAGDPGDLTGKVPLFDPMDNPSQAEIARRVRVMKERGAQVVLSGSYADDLSILPIVQLFDYNGIDRMRGDLARGPVDVRVDGRRDSPYSYFNAATVPGRIPDGHTFRFERKDMGQVDGTFAALKPTDDFNRLVMTANSPNLSAGFEVNTRWPQRRTDYYSPGFTWRSQTAVSFVPVTYQAAGYELTSPVDLKAGERRAVCMYCAPFGPELAQPQPDRQTGKPLPWAYRQGDKLTFEVPMFGSRDPSTFTFIDYADKGSTVLSHNGREIGRNDAPGRDVFDIPPGAGRYTLVSDATKDAPDWPLSVRTKAEWTFLTTPVSDRGALPLLDIRFDLPLDGYNSAPAEGISGFVHAGQQSDVARLPIRAVSVEISFDDGTSWRPAQVVRDGSRWKADLPGGTGFASLRATASDIAGNSVTETMIRAYRVR